MNKIQLDSSLLKPFEFLSIEQAGIAIKEYSNFLKTRQIKILEDNAANLAYHYLTESTLSFWQQQEETRLRRATGGSRGGRPKKNNQKNHKVTKVLKGENASISQNPLIDNKNIIKEENIIRDNNINIRDNNISPNGDNIIPTEKNKEEVSTYVSTSLSISQEKADKKKTSKESEDIDFAKLFEYFNSAMQDKAIKPISRMTAIRKSFIRARVREFSEKALYTAIDKAATSDFLNGKNNRNWVADFDWMMRPNNFPKVLEGNYDNRAKNESLLNTKDPMSIGVIVHEGEMDYSKGGW